MRRYLVVANQTLLGDPLPARIERCLATGPCQFRIVTLELPTSTVTAPAIAKVAR